MKCLQLLPVQFHDSRSLPHSEKQNIQLFGRDKLIF